MKCLDTQIIGCIMLLDKLARGEIMEKEKKGYGHIILEYKEEHNLTYRGLIEQMFEKFPDKCFDRQAIEGWKSERHAPNVFTLEALAVFADGELKEMLQELIPALYNYKVREKVRWLKEGEK